MTKVCSLLELVLVTLHVSEPYKDRLHVGIENAGLVAEGECTGIPHRSQGVKCVPGFVDSAPVAFICSATFADNAAEVSDFVGLVDVFSSKLEWCLLLVVDLFHEF